LPRKLAHANSRVKKLQSFSTDGTKKGEKNPPFFRFFFVGKQTKITNKTRRTGEIANHSRLVVSRETISSEWQNHLGTFFFIIKSQSMESCFLSEKKLFFFFFI